jgi:hypothetical protein
MTSRKEHPNTREVHVQTKKLWKPSKFLKAPNSQMYKFLIKAHRFKIHNHTSYQMKAPYSSTE